MTRSLLVWGNCQAVAVADLLRRTLPPAEYEVIRVPPVYVLTHEQLPRIRSLVRLADVVITQPVSDTYRVPGVSTSAVAELLKPDAMMITFPIAYTNGPFPFQVRGYDGDGERIDAPVTDYHDLRALVAARRGYSAERAVRWWPAAPADAVRSLASTSRRELQRRESGLTVAVSDRLERPDAMWTMTHPSNVTVAHVVTDLLRALAIDATVRTPAYECLGARRAPVGPDVADALGWPASAVRRRWCVDDEVVDDLNLVDQQLAFYTRRTDVVAATLDRHRDRVELLGLTG